MNETSQPNTNLPVQSQKTWTRKFIALVAGLIILGVAACAGIWYWYSSTASPSTQTPVHKVNSTATRKAYTNSQYGFEFKYPADWKLVSQEIPSTSDNLLFLIVTPPKAEGFSFVVESFRGTLSEHLSSLKKKERIVSFEPYSFLGRSAYLVQTHCMGPCTVIEIENNGYLYSISLPTEATVEEIEKYKILEDYPELNQIFSTFKFTDSTTIINSFASCAAAGYPIMESFPEQCRTPEGLTFVKPQGACIQVIAQAKNPKTGEVREFPTPCDIPSGWELVSPAQVQSQGTLTGHVTIGPNCPVEQIDNPCPPPPAAYTSRKVQIYSSDGKTLITSKNLDTGGNYSIKLDPGKYMANIDRAMIGPTELKNATITASKTTTLNLDVDTGIR